MALTYEQQIGAAPKPPAFEAPTTTIDASPMKGTTGTSFKLVAAFLSGRLGYRNLGSGQFRVRVEPTQGYNLSFPNGPTGWTQPGDGGQNRFSIVVQDQTNLRAALKDAAQRLAAACA